VKLERIISFGYRYGNPPQQAPGVVIIDVRKMFNNPYHDRKLRNMRGTDLAVQEEVMRTPHFDTLYNHLIEKVTAPGVEIAYIGCTGGHHRSVFLALKLAKQLGVQCEHRDINK
jgi:UPF0042 nucleotide-binding protein